MFEHVAQGTRQKLDAYLVHLHGFFGYVVDNQTLREVDLVLHAHVWG